MTIEHLTFRDYPDGRYANAQLDDWIENVQSDFKLKIVAVSTSFNEGKKVIDIYYKLKAKKSCGWV